MTIIARPVRRCVGDAFFRQLFVAVLAVFVKGKPEFFNVSFGLGRIVAFGASLDRIVFIPDVFTFFVNVVALVACHAIVFGVHEVFKMNRSFPIGCVHLVIECYVIRRFSRHQTTNRQEDKTGPDNLRLIAGIGPKISTVLVDAGIVTFAQLAATEVEELRQILTDAGVRIAYPDTWPEQAALAAAESWEDLRRLRSQLDRGRRVESSS